MSAPEKLLLSYSAAAKLLGVSRNDTLHALIKTGLLRPVLLLGRAYIPREQVEQLARTGERRIEPPPPRKSRAIVRTADLKLF